MYSQNKLGRVRQQSAVQLQSYSPSDSMKPTMEEVSEKIFKPGEEGGVELSEVEQRVLPNGLGRSLSDSTAGEEPSINVGQH